MANDVQIRVLEALSGARNYRRWVCELAQPHLGDDPLEIGSGLGDYAQEWLDGGLERTTVSEAEPELVRRLDDRFAGDRRVSVATMDLQSAAEGEFSSVVALNVLEHIEDDVMALRGTRRLLRPGGAVVLFVPAVPAAMSRFDRSIGHHRRYTPHSLRRAMTAAGLTVERLHYVNAPGLVAWFVGMRILGMTPREGGLLTVWDRLVVPVTRAVESRVTPPIGQSLFAVGHRSSPQR